MKKNAASEEIKHSLPHEVQFIQAIIVDINGIGRGKMFSIEKLNDLMNNQEEITYLVDISGTNSEVPQSIAKSSNGKNGNVIMIPDRNTLKIPPWIKNFNVAMVFCDLYDKTTNLPRPFNPRLMCKNKLQELENFGYQLLIGVEHEFRLFDKKTKSPFISRFCFDEQYMQITMALPFAIQMREQAMKAGIEFESFNLEAGLGQIEFPLTASFGIDAVDKVWIFRELSKYVANDMGWIASYMTAPLANQSANGMHINHSLWEMYENSFTNVFHEPTCQNELSQIGKHWLAGLLKHSKALSAIFSPTVNCYRRIRLAVDTTNEITWNYGDRKVAMRVKVSEPEAKMNFIENRLPSSACNIYLAIAGMIVAGLDGIQNKLELIPFDDRDNVEKLPQSLSEALEIFKADQVLCQGLGEGFVDFYVKSKMDTDVEILKEVDIDSITVEGLVKEMDKYLHL